MQPRLLYGDVLYVIDLRWVGEAEDAADALAHLVVTVWPRYLEVA
jgi:hypothetical protein